MKRTGIFLIVFALAGVVFATTGAGVVTKKTAICHRTASAKTPYVRQLVSGSALKRALSRPADIVPAPRVCPKTVLSPTSGGVAFAVTLTGEAEAPAGDPVATGSATFHLRAGQGQVCYSLAAKNLPPAVAAHIHQGDAGASGGVVVPLKTPDASGNSSGCVRAARGLVKTILGDPGSFYANIHTQAFPGGAIRGQLAGTSPAAIGTVFALTLVGTSEPNAKGTAVLRIRKDALMVCYRLHVGNITLPSVGAHIHRGAAGVNGPVVVPFTAPDANGDSAGCTAATAALIDEILGNPAGFYVNVHSKEHPAGAIRAQLA
jgi:hypothetical protein